MQLNRNIGNNCIPDDNKGFSLVEIIIAVAVLAIIFTPILRSFMLASVTNSKAQQIQNATSLAEDIMEKVKGESIEELHKDAVSGTDAAKIKFLSKDQTDETNAFVNTPPYTIYYSDVTATQGRTYDAEVIISRDQYGQTSASDVSDANERELPKLGKINSEQHAVLSWEINKHDGEVLSKLAEENAKNDAEKASLKSTIPTNGEKNINITIEDDAGRAKITCDIEYTTGSAAYNNSLKYLVYTGRFNDLSSDPNGGPNIYLFYTISAKASPGEYFKKENIKIEDKTTGKRHNVYFILQNGMDKLYDATTSTKISLNVSGNGWTACNLDESSSITSNTWTLSEGADTTSTADDVELITNLLKSGATDNKNSNLFNSEKKDRVYYVTVNIKKHGENDILATLTSTMKTGKEATAH